jgi:hypothetical protein
LLRERHPREAVDLDVDVDLAFDLNVDSFGWMEITVALQDRLDIDRSEIGALPWSQFRHHYRAGELVRIFSKPARSPVLPSRARLPGPRSPSRRRARERPSGAEGRPCRSGSPRLDARRTAG